MVAVVAVTEEGLGEAGGRAEVGRAGEGRVEGQVAGKAVEALGGSVDAAWPCTAQM